MVQHGTSEGNHVLWGIRRFRLRHQLEDGAIGIFFVNDGTSWELFNPFETDILIPRLRFPRPVPLLPLFVVLNHPSGFDKAGSDAPAIFFIAPVTFTCTILSASAHNQHARDC